VTAKRKSFSWYDLRVCIAIGRRKIPQNPNIKYEFQLQHSRRKVNFRVSEIPDQVNFRVSVNSKSPMIKLSLCFAPSNCYSMHLLALRLQNALCVCSPCIPFFNLSICLCMCMEISRIFFFQKNSRNFPQTEFKKTASVRRAVVARIANSFVQYHLMFESELINPCCAVSTIVPRIINASVTRSYMNRWHYSDKSSLLMRCCGSRK
jgi:hypothetical protein